MVCPANQLTYCPAVKHSAEPLSLKVPLGGGKGVLRGEDLGEGREGKGAKGIGRRGLGEKTKGDLKERRKKQGRRK